MSEWQKKVENSLKGKSIDTLSRIIYEKIRLKPIYTKEDLADKPISQFSGLPDFRRGFYPLEYAKSEWKIAQRIPATTAEELHTKLSKALQNGQTAISFEVTQPLIRELPNIITDFYKTYPFSLNAKQHHSQLLTKLSELAKEDSKELINGFIGMDPLALLVETGFLEDDLNLTYDQWANTIKKTNVSLPNLRTILVDTIPYHNGGANAVQELAVAIATGVHHIRSLTERLLSIETIFKKMVFSFAVGSQFFVEIAKLRAAKILWSKIAEAYEVSMDHQAMEISAETSLFTKTEYDSYVNLLRAGSEAFAAVLGGIQYLHVNPYKIGEDSNTPLVQRIARNIQLILKEESYVKNVVDPAGGSWYIESLTNELAEKAWELFLSIEDQGGIEQVLKSNWLQEQILKVKMKRQNDVVTKKQSVVGTNVYTDPNEEFKQKSVLKNNEQFESKRKIIQPIHQERLTEPYEKLRQKENVAEKQRMEDDE
jgi:methylmalonyl-CoA mutase